MNICIFCSANDVAQNYQQAAAEFARILAERGHTLVWGGSNKGMMKLIADSAQNAGGKIIGISVEFFRKNARVNADEMIYAPDLASRKIMMEERSDAFVVLVGGTGSLDEAMEVIELKKYEKHNKPVVFLNTDGFYNPLKEQFEKMRDGGFLHFPLEKIVEFAETPIELINILEKDI